MLLETYKYLCVYSKDIWGGAEKFFSTMNLKGQNLKFGYLVRGKKSSISYNMNTSIYTHSLTLCPCNFQHWKQKISIYTRMINASHVPIKIKQTSPVAYWYILQVANGINIKEKKDSCHCSHYTSSRVRQWFLSCCLRCVEKKKCLCVGRKYSALLHRKKWLGRGSSGYGLLSD